MHVEHLCDTELILSFLVSCFCWVGHSSKFKAMLAAMGYITPEQLAGRVTTGKGRGWGKPLAMRFNALAFCCFRLHRLRRRSVGC